MLQKSRNAVFFQWFVCQVSRKVGLLKRRVRRSVVFGEIKNCTQLWRNAHFQVKMYKTLHSRSTFWSPDVEKLHAAVAKRTFVSENVQNTSCSGHFLKSWCRKIARRCGETHICKWKCTKHYILGALFEVSMLKNCTPLWRNAHLAVKMYKTLHSRSTFWSPDVEKLHAAVAKRTFVSENVQNTTFSEHFLKFRCWKIARRCGETHILQFKCTKHYILGALFEVLMSKNCTPLWRNAHFEVKTLKNWRSWTTFWSLEVEKVHSAVAKRTFVTQNVQNTCVLPHFWS